MELLIITLILIFILIVFIYIYETNINLFTRGFRFINSHDTNKVNLGRYEKSILNTEIIDDVLVKVKYLPDASIRFYSLKDNKKDLPVVMFIHGGGWVGGSAEKIEPFCKLIASNGYVVASVNYSLAPEYPYPTSTIQLVECLNYIYNNSKKYKIDKERFFIGGTSAGAHLSSQLGCLVSSKKYQEEVGVSVDVPKISGLLLINGVYNFDTVGDSKFPGIKHFVWAYMDEKNNIDKDKLDEVSTIKHINKKFPPSFITAGDKDPLKSQSLELIEILKKNDIDYKDVFFENSNLYHDFIYRLNNEKAAITYEELIKFLYMNE